MYSSHIWDTNLFPGWDTLWGLLALWSLGFLPWEPPAAFFINKNKMKLEKTQIKERRTNNRHNMDLLHERVFFWSLSLSLPRQADVTHTVSQVTVTSEALLYGPVKFLTAALGPDRHRTPAHWGVPSAGWVLRFARFYQLFHQGKKYKNKKIQWLVWLH